MSAEDNPPGQEPPASVAESSSASISDSGLPNLPEGYTLPANTQEGGELLRAKLLGETARAPWSELQRFFAQGIVLAAAPDVDMLSVAMALAEDDRERFEEFLNLKQAGPVTDEQASKWIETDATLWTVVVKPWILVQEIAAQETPAP